MTLDVASLSLDARARLTTLLVNAGHLSHALRLEARIETDLPYEAVEAQIKATLPAHMIPDQIITKAALPRLPNGKLDRNSPLEPLDTSTPAPKRPQDASPETLEVLRTIWSDVLGSESIYDEDNFVEMGGDSLLSISVVARARAAGIALLPSDLFDFPSLYDLAKRVSFQTDKAELADVAQGPLDLSNNENAGAGQPIFLLNANRKMMELLNEQLTTGRTMHVITLHWDSGQISANETIRSIAQGLLTRMRQIQPEGPYSVAGFSMGAVAAHEIAQILQAQNIELRELILIDPPENPKLFMASNSNNSDFTPSPDEMMTARRKLVQTAALTLGKTLNNIGATLPDKLRRRYAAAVYFNAARRYAIQAPPVAPIIVRRARGYSATLWSSVDHLRALHEVACTHREFHTDDAVIKEWTGVLAQTLDR